MGTWIHIIAIRMKKQIHYFIFFLFILAASVSCNKDSAPDYLQTTGEIVREERPVEDFTEIELYHKINVVLTQDIQNKIEIEAGKNLIPDITTEVKDEKLKIKNENKFNFLRSYKKEITLYISVKNLSHITYRGAGNISCTNTLTDSVFTFDSRSGTGKIELNINANEGHFNHHTGQCDLVLHGNIGVNYLYQAGNGFTDAEDLNTGYTFVTNKGTNDLKIKVEKVLYAYIAYLGNVYYKGDPYDLSSDIVDQGQLIKLY